MAKVKKINKPTIKESYIEKAKQIIAASCNEAIESGYCYVSIMENVEGNKANLLTAYKSLIGFIADSQVRFLRYRVLEVIKGEGENKNKALVFLEKIIKCQAVNSETGEREDLQFTIPSLRNLSNGQAVDFAKAHQALEDFKKEKVDAFMLEHNDRGNQAQDKVNYHIGVAIEYGQILVDLCKEDKSLDTDLLDKRIKETKQNIYKQKDKDKKEDAKRKHNLYVHIKKNIKDGGELLTYLTEKKDEANIEREKAQLEADKIEGDLEELQAKLFIGDWEDLEVAAQHEELASDLVNVFAKTGKAVLDAPLITDLIGELSGSIVESRKAAPLTEIRARSITRKQEAKIIEKIEEIEGGIKEIDVEISEMIKGAKLKIAPIIKQVKEIAFEKSTELRKNKKLKDRAGSISQKIDKAGGLIDKTKEEIKGELYELLLERMDLVKSISIQKTRLNSKLNTLYFVNVNENRMPTKTFAIANKIIADGGEVPEEIKDMAVSMATLLMAEGVEKEEAVIKATRIARLISQRLDGNNALLYLLATTMTRYDEDTLEPLPLPTDIEEIERRVEFFKSANLYDSMGVYNFFLSFSKDLLKNTKTSSNTNGQLRESTIKSLQT